jgi:hypothetical protein
LCKDLLVLLVLCKQVLKLAQVLQQELLLVVYKLALPLGQVLLLVPYKQVLQLALVLLVVYKLAQRQGQGL